MIDRCLHSFQSDEMLPERLNCPYYYQPHPLCLKAAEDVQRIISEHKDWQEEISKGKMFGVLIVKTLNSRLSTLDYLTAYSGQILGRSDWEGFVPAVFDYLEPEGYFKTEERNIDDINVRVRELEASPVLAELRARLRDAEAKGHHRIEAYRQEMADSKAQREQMRREGRGDAEAMIRESQFQKAELKRLKAAVNAELLPLRESLKEAEGQILNLKQERKRRSDALQQWLFSQFVMLNGNREKCDLIDIFDTFYKKRSPLPASPFRGGERNDKEREDLLYRRVFIPSGAGECCAPKLLQYAFQHGYTPVAMAEFWWGESPKGEIRHHLDFYPACQGKCRPILDFMLQGIDVEPNPLDEEEKTERVDIIYEDECYIAINKPAGMLSVPGKGQRLSAQEILQRQISQDSSHYGENVFPVHRLDMQTSGVLLFAKSEVQQRIMRGMFESRGVKKTYVALLEGVLGESVAREGVIELPLAADYINRPMQKVDYKDGKPSKTIYNIYGTREGHTAVELHPLTGRTHQLRVHCAHPDGLGMPILGDDLYGHHDRRLCLHARSLEFEHPVSHKQIKIIADNLDF